MDAIVFIIVSLSTLALFTPVFSGYVLGFLMLCVLLISRIYPASAENNVIKQQFDLYLKPISKNVLIFWALLAIAACASFCINTSVDLKLGRHVLGNAAVKYPLLWFTYKSFWYRPALKPNLWRVFSTSYGGVAVLHAVYCLLQRQYGFDWAHGLGQILPEGRFSYGVFRVSGFAGHPLTLGYCQALALVVAVHFFRRAEFSWEKISWLLVLLSAAFVLAISGSRGPLLVGAVGVLSGFSRRDVALHLKPAVIGGCLILLAGWQLGFFLRFLEYFHADGSGDMRGVHLHVFWNIFKDYPVWGIGPGAPNTAITAYYSLFGVNDSMMIAHNTFLQFAAEWGLLGLVGCLIWLVSWFKVSILVPTLRHVLRALLVVVVLGGMTQNDLQDSTFMLSLTLWTLLLVAKEVSISECAEGRTNTKNYVTAKGGEPT